MNNLPPIVIECPTCGERYLLPDPDNTPSEKRIAFSDGYFSDPEVWRVPGIIGCTTCELGFLPVKGKIVAQPDWIEFHSKWSGLKKAEPPLANALALELRVRKTMGPELERMLRVELWYAGTHTENGSKLLQYNTRFSDLWYKNLTLLEILVDGENSQERLLKAEINRQLGNFDACIKWLEGQNTYDATRIKEMALDKNPGVFPLGPDWLHAG